MLKTPDANYFQEQRVIAIQNDITRGKLNSDMILFSAKLRPLHSPIKNRSIIKNVIMNLDSGKCVSLLLICSKY